MTPCVFGVSIEGGAWEVVKATLQQRASSWIVTTNPEILLAAHEDHLYKNALLAADWRTVDGFGLGALLRLRGFHASRCTGVDLAEELMALAAQQGKHVALFGGSPQALEGSLAYWRKRFPSLVIRGYGGGRVDEDGREDGRTWEDREAMQVWRPDVLLVALGGGTKQERWIAHHRAAWQGIRVIVGVGGAFDMWSGIKPRAPKVLRLLGLEWAWRLAIEPTRWKRILRAFVVFPIRAWRHVVRG
ncbi:WecB/TagA/CpsF family glycosyltransferase [Patescibacteria group bacterium]|nr:WecB/TagA/CpsF family glycosyltransferase [Patescibacteria group bacterium]